MSVADKTSRGRVGRNFLLGGGRPVVRPRQIVPGPQEIYRDDHFECDNGAVESAVSLQPEYVEAVVRGLFAGGVADDNA